MLVATARAAGATSVRVVRRRKHPAIEGYAASGDRFLVTFPGTSSDRRSIRNSVSQLRRVLAVKEGRT